jgi:perosamine synthetase
MIPVCEPLLDGNERKYVDDCLESGWISSAGKYVTEFEDKFAKYCGCKYGVTTTSGTTALHLALASLGIGPCDEVIVPTFTIAACAFAVLYTGATPVFVDCDPATYNIDPDGIERAITDKTRAIMPVHIYGHCCDMTRIMEIVKGKNIFVVEDAAEAHGSEINGRRAGGIGHVGCFSFYGNKVATCGEGGMLVTNDGMIAAKATQLKDLAHSRDKRFLHMDVGFNYRMTNIQAAIGLAQLESLDYHIELRRQHAERYNEQLQGLVATPVEMAGYMNTYWMYAILLKNQAQRDGLMKYLEKAGIGTRTFFIPMNQQPILDYLCVGQKFPIADNVSARGLYLPSGTGLSDGEIDVVCDAVKEYLRCT